MNELLRQGKVKRCPKCGIVSQKIDGCNFLQCHSCKTPWCWYCGDTHDDCHCGHNEHKPMNIPRPNAAAIGMPPPLRGRGAPRGARGGRGRPVVMAPPPPDEDEDDDEDDQGSGDDE